MFHWALSLSLALGASFSGAPAQNKEGLGLQAKVLDDGTSLFLVPRPSATESALRIVVRTGAAQESDKQRGLAHFVQHAIMRGSYWTTEEELLRRLTRSGAELSAYTFPDHTVFGVDCPSKRLDFVLETFIAIVTNPAFAFVDLNREREELAIEGLGLSEVSVPWLGDRFLFPRKSQNTNDLGNSRTRLNIRKPDLLEFFGTYYVPANTSIVVVGRFDAKAIRGVLERTSRVPPASLTPSPQPKLALPVSVKKEWRVPQAATILGYPLSSSQAEICRNLAYLLDLRLVREVQVKGGLARSVNARCVSMRGYEFVLATALGMPHTALLLRDKIRALFRGLGRAPPTAKEQSIVRQRFARLAEKQRRDPSFMADRLVAELASSHGADARDRVELLLRSPRFSFSAMRRAVRSGFRQDKEMLIQMVPPSPRTKKPRYGASRDAEIVLPEPKLPEAEPDETKKKAPSPDADAKVPPKAGPGGQDARRSYDEGMTLRSKRDYKSAVKAFTEALRGAPDFVSALNARALSYQALGSLTKAESDFDKALSVDPQNASIYNNRGLVRHQRKNLKGAIKDFSRAIDIDSRHGAALENRGAAYLESGLSKKAVSDFDRASKLHPELARLHVKKGLAEQKLNNFSAALRSFNRAIDIEPRNVKAYVGRGAAYAKLKKCSQAVDDFSKVLKFKPAMASVYLQRALAYRCLRQKPAAVRDFKRFIQLDPKSPHRPKVEKQIRALSD